MSGLRVCVISSGNGGAFKAFCRLTGVTASNVLIITDRPCGIEAFARESAIEHVRVEAPRNEDFSELAAGHIARFGGVDFVFLFFTRLVTPALWDRYPVVNFHPSLLPAFPGFQPIQRALQKRVKFFGTTMHLVDNTVDDGAILAQAICPLGGAEDADRLEQVAFFHKVYFMLLVAENFEESGNTKLDFSRWPSTERFNPSLRTLKYQDLYGAVFRYNEAMDPPIP